MSMHMAQIELSPRQVLTPAPVAREADHPRFEAADPALAPARGIATAILMSVPFWLAAGITLYFVL